MVSLILTTVDCSVSAKVVPKFTCLDDIMTVEWPTDTTLATNVIPDKLKLAINNRLANRGSMFHIVLLNQQPP